jgi:glycosyltransferase involved in cell wall biosynthesis
MRISAIVTAHNEGVELRRTIDSVRSHTRHLHEIIVVDDGSTDGSCADLAEIGVTLLRHEHRTGVAFSRHAATRVASGDVYCFLDGHQRVEAECIDQCARVAIRRNAIVSPEIHGLYETSKPVYGAAFQLCPDNGFFSARWIGKYPRCRVTKHSALRGPGYVIPRALYEDVGWIPSLRGWGGSEAVVGLKAFFLGIDVLYLRGAISYHLFRRKFPYRTTWDEIWRNHAILARVCFDDRTWHEHWLPELFDQRLTDETRLAVESLEVMTEREKFLKKKVRPDRDFWCELIGADEPLCMRIENDGRDKSAGSGATGHKR